MALKKYIKKIALYLFNATAWLFPITGFYSLRRILLTIAGLKIGRNVRINGLTRFIGDGDVHIDDDTWIGINSSFYLTRLAKITIGKQCDIAPDVKFVPGSHIPGYSTRRAGQPSAENIVIENGCWIGAGVTILGGVTIGSGSIIGACSLVDSDIPPNSLAVGVPATVKKMLDAK